MIGKSNIPLLPKKELKEKPEGSSRLRARLHEIIFEAETKEGRLFDIILLVMILASILVLMLETVPDLAKKYMPLFITIEWTLTVFFTIEYFLRLYAVKRPVFYAKSFYGIVDLASILPNYLTLFFPGAHSLMIIRALRLLRMFRVFKLESFIDQGNLILSALNDSKQKIIVFSIFISIAVCIFGSIMYLAEYNSNPGFDSIPRSIYWAIVTITTVGYGDISPKTPFGQFIAVLIMMLGYVIIAIPTGIVTSSIIQKSNDKNTITCPNCAKEGHSLDAKYCDNCGHSLENDLLI